MSERDRDDFYRSQINAVNTVLSGLSQLSLADQSNYGIGDLQKGLANYENGLRDKLRQKNDSLSLTSSTTLNGSLSRPTKPPMRLNKFRIERNERNDSKQSHLRRKPPLKQSHSSNSNSEQPLLCLSVRIPHCADKKIEIYPGDDIDIKVLDFCKNHQILNYFQTIKDVAESLIKS